MKLALIPPPHLLHTTAADDYHLVVPAMWDDKNYRTFYAGQRMAAPKLIILDNGAAEDVAINPRDLLTLADELMADEIVVPDVIADSNASKLVHGEFMEVVDDQDDDLPDLMGVVQGKTMDECLDHVDFLEKWPQITTLGIPRHLVKTIGTRTRIVLMNTVSDRYSNRFQIHMLGASPLWIEEVRHIADECLPIVRGIDTSLPYVYTKAGEDVATSRKVLRRSEDYFTVWPYDVGLLEHNLVTYRTWCEGE